MQLEFMNVGKAMAEVWRLEQVLGIEQSGPIFNIRRANERVQTLRTQLGAKASQPPTAAEKKASSDAFTNKHIADLIAKGKEAVAQPQPRFDTETLAALVDSVFGHGTAKQVCHVPLFLNVRDGADDIRRASLQAGRSKAETEAQLQAVRDAEVARHSTFGRDQAQPARDEELKAQLAARDAEIKATSFNKLRGFLLSRGVTVPGLSFAGLRTDNREYVSPKAAAVTQDRVARFMAVIDGNEQSVFDTSTIAEAARAFVAQRTGKPYTVGAKLEPKKL